MRIMVGAVALVCLVAASAGAKAVIKVEKDTYNADTILEGTRDAVTHAFVIRNTGDEPLTIKAVRPG